MKYNIIMFSSVTLAMKAKNILANYGINTKLIRTPMHLTNKSCGYSLAADNLSLRALEILRSNGISVLGSAVVDKI